MELVTALLLPILLIELYTWLPTISEWVLELNVRRLCVEDQEQFREDWKANLNEYPNTMVKLVHALSSTIATTRINRDFFEHKFAEIGRHLEKVSNQHNQNLRELLKIQSKVAERKRLVSEFELSLQDKVAIVETTTTARPELMQRAVDSFQKLGHSYLGVFHRATTLLDLMIDRHKSKTDEFERSLKVFYEKYRDATKLSFVGWRSSHVVSRLKELDDNASILREVAEYKSDENDEYMKELRIIIRVLQTRNSADKSQSP